MTIFAVPSCLMVNLSMKIMIWRKLTKAYLDAGTYLDEHPKAQEEISSKYMKFNDSVIERSLKVIGFKDLALTEDRYNALVHHMTHIDLIKRCRVIQSL